VQAGGGALGVVGAREGRGWRRGAGVRASDGKEGAGIGAGRDAAGEGKEHAARIGGGEERGGGGGCVHGGVLAVVWLWCVRPGRGGGRVFIAGSIRGGRCGKIFSILVLFLLYI
jgi:hypothetical protein